MKQIVIAIQGFVFIGEAERMEHEDGIRLTGAAVIRKWGTTAGLGQIALQGPTSETVFDPCGIVKIPTSSVVATIDVVAKFKTY